jgi:hypothetical protein
MVEAEARWLRGMLDGFPPDRLSPLLSLGSSSAEIREAVQPWIADQVFHPLQTRGVEVDHVDMRELSRVDVRADLTDPSDMRRLSLFRARAVLCCNLLEHVAEPERLARHCLELVAPGGLLFVTVPFSYPHHRDPIDTMYHPGPAVLAELLATRACSKAPSSTRRSPIAMHNGSGMAPAAPSMAFPGAVLVVRTMETFDGATLLARRGLPDDLRRIRKDIGPRGHQRRDLLGPGLRVAILDLKVLPHGIAALA